MNIDKVKLTCFSEQLSVVEKDRFFFVALYVS